jgi:hypothetical protein
MTTSKKNEYEIESCLAQINFDESLLLELGNTLIL